MLSVTTALCRKKMESLLFCFFFSIETLQDNKQTKLPFSCHVASFYISPDAPVNVASDSTNELHSGAHKIIKVLGQVTSLPPQVFRSSLTLISRSMHLKWTHMEFQKSLPNNCSLKIHNAETVKIHQGLQNRFMAPPYSLGFWYAKFPSTHCYFELDIDLF